MHHVHCRVKLCARGGNRVRSGWGTGKMESGRRSGTVAGETRMSKAWMGRLQKGDGRF